MNQIQQHHNNLAIQGLRSHVNDLKKENKQLKDMLNLAQEALEFYLKLTWQIHERDWRKPALDALKDIRSYNAR